MAYQNSFNQLFYSFFDRLIFHLNSLIDPKFLLQFFSIQKIQEISYSFFSSTIFEKDQNFQSLINLLFLECYSFFHKSFLWILIHFLQVFYYFLNIFLFLYIYRFKKLKNFIIYFYFTFNLVSYSIIYYFNLQSIQRIKSN